jgi:hypothetical protein
MINNSQIEKFTESHPPSRANPAVIAFGPEDFPETTG